MKIPEDAGRKVAAAYNAAADTYDHPANGFWEHYGRRTVERLQLPTGAKVLDACCGSGASAIPAAQAVGPGGSVLGIDLARELLDLARRKAKERGLENVTFREADIQDLGLPAASFHAVICVFGIFFVPDMPAALRALWHLVAPGGRLAVTTWGPRLFEPGSTAFWESVRAVRPDLYRQFNPWDRISDPESVRALLVGAGVEDPDVVAEAGSHPIASPEDWWSMVLGTGYRGTVDQMEPSERERVRRENLEFIRSQDVRSVEANVMYAVARKPAGTGLFP